MAVFACQYACLSHCDNEKLATEGMTFYIKKLKEC